MPKPNRKWVNSISFQALVLFILSLIVTYCTYDDERYLKKLSTTQH